MDQSAALFVVRKVDNPEEITRVTLAVMHSLPAWFSPPEDIDRKSILHRDMPFFAAYATAHSDATAHAGAQAVGFAALKEHNEFTSEIFNIGILEDYQRFGIGGALLSAAEAYCIACGRRFLTVKTLDVSADYEPYDRTRAFYHKAGFLPLEVLTNHWNEENPCLFLAKWLQ